jgi:hypothetical protein
MAFGTQNLFVGLLLLPQETEIMKITVFWDVNPYNLVHCSYEEGSSFFRNVGINL